MDAVRILLVIAGLGALGGDPGRLGTGRYRAPGKDPLDLNWAWTALPATGAMFVAFGLAPRLGLVADRVALPVVLAGFVLLLW